MRYFPLFLDLQKKPCVVIGGGQVAERKVLNLLRAGARVSIVAPEVTQTLRRLQEKGKIRIRLRPFRAGDVGAACLVIAATNSRPINERVFREASNLRIPVNVVDDPAYCSFIIPSVISRGDILLAISTGGQSPALAKALRKKIQGEIGPEYTVLLKILGAVRRKSLSLSWAAGKKQRIFRHLLREDFLEMIREKNQPAIDAFLKRFIGSGFSLKELGLKS